MFSKYPSRLVAIILISVSLPCLAVDAEQSIKIKDSENKPLKPSSNEAFQKILSESEKKPEKPTTPQEKKQTSTSVPKKQIKTNLPSGSGKVILLKDQAQ